jgi:hypothetical protein
MPLRFRFIFRILFPNPSWEQDNSRRSRGKRHILDLEINPRLGDEGNSAAQRGTCLPFQECIGSYFHDFFENNKRLSLSP